MRRTQSSGAFLSGASNAREAAMPAAWWSQHGADHPRGGGAAARGADAAWPILGGRAGPGAVAAAVFSNGYRSLRALVRQLGEGRINGMDARRYLESVLAAEERDGIAPALLDEQRREARVPSGRFALVHSVSAMTRAPESLI